MSVTTLVVNLSSNYSLSVGNSHGVVCLGTDWGDTLKAGAVIPAGSTGYTVGTIGDPGFGETNHWGWLYFFATPTGGGLSFPIQLYMNEGSSHDVVASAGYYDSCSSESNPMPSGTIGSTVVTTDPPSGKVTYSIG